MADKPNRNITSYTINNQPTEKLKIELEKLKYKIKQPLESRIFTYTKKDTEIDYTDYTLDYNANIPAWMPTNINYNQYMQQEIPTRTFMPYNREDAANGSFIERVYQVYSNVWTKYIRFDIIHELIEHFSKFEEVNLFKLEIYEKEASARIFYWHQFNNSDIAKRYAREKLMSYDVNCKFNVYSDNTSFTIII